MKLKTGMNVQFANGDFAVIVGDMAQTGVYGVNLNDYDSNLDHHFSGTISIAKVWDVNTCGGLYNMLNEDLFGELILDRGFFD